MKKRDLANIHDVTGSEIENLCSIATSLKKDTALHAQALAGTSVALVFQKPSNRTRVSFEVGIWQLGGQCIYLSPREIALGQREATADVAQTLSRYVDCIVARTNAHDDITALAANASACIINGLSDLFHPCQALADIFTIKEKFGRLKGLKLAYVGDGNNVCHSLLLGCAKVGLNITVATPKKYKPQDNIVSDAQKLAHETQAQIVLTDSPADAVANADVVYTDVWTSMGQEAEQKQRLAAFKAFQVNTALLKKAKNTAVFMHCLPAHRGQEVSNDVMDSAQSIVFDQAENRMHMQKAILLLLLGKIT